MKVPIKRYERDEALSWEGRYHQLERHHEEETSWMAVEIKRLKKAVEGGGSWRAVVERVARQTGILNDAGVLLPHSEDPAWRDNVVYHVAGHAENELDAGGFDDVNSWEIVAYTFELLVPGAKGHFDKILAHIDKHGWGCALPGGIK